jgi:lipid-A-disaccharide synthase
MPMRIFLSAGEPSGDMHGANLVGALRRRCPDIECVGFGGDKMAAAGCGLLYPLCRLAVMWFARVLANAPTFLRLVSRADRFFRHHRPDAVVLIDYPGFNWWLARRAHFHGIPVFYFVPPQLWGWAGWRVHKMQRWVDHVLCNLPFEQEWYSQRGVQAHYIGHPYFDELVTQRLDATYLARERERGGEIVGILPGSRTQELERNFSSMIRAAEIVHSARPTTRFLVACFRETHQEMARAYLAHHRGLPIDVALQRTPEIIELARTCLAVSGSVSLELLYRAKPTVIVYRIGRVDLFVARSFIKSPYITLVNLMAGKELFPEFLTDRCEAEAMARATLNWLEDPKAHDATAGELVALRERVARPGACDRAAEFILASLAGRSCRAA